MAKRKKTARPEDADKLLAAYEGVFDEITRFIELIRIHEADIEKAETKADDCKGKYEKAKLELSELRSIRDGAKHSLYRFLAPGPAELLPLFDRMEKPDEEKHGAGAAEWRKEPLVAIKLSLPAITLLNEADIMFVGQLQDRVQASPEDWWKVIEGISAGQAAAIVDRLNAFIAEATRK